MEDGNVATAAAGARPATAHSQGGRRRQAWCSSRHSLLWPAVSLATKPEDCRCRWR